MKSHQHCAGPRRRDRGFTLVETTAVIAITGILAATALPRMTDLAGEARYVSLDHARGALSTVAAMSHAKFLIDGATTQQVEDGSISLVHGYPAASQAIVNAAGLSTHYVLQPHAPGAMRLVPKAIAGTPRAQACFLIYEQASATKPRPAIRLGDSTSAASCA